MRWQVLALGLLVAGCGSSPKTHFYTLVPETPAAADPAPTHGPKLRVGRIELPSTLDRTSLVTLGPGTAVSVSDQDRWAAPLKELVQRTLTADLRARLGPSRILDPGDPTPPAGVHIVALNLQAFGADSSGEVVLAGDWTLARSAGGSQRVLGVHPVTLRDSAGSTQAGPVSAAMSGVLGKLADRIAAADAGEMPRSDQRRSSLAAAGAK